MRGFDAYQTQKNKPSWTRIDMLLAAYDGTLSRLKEAQRLLEAGDEFHAQPLLIRSQRIVVELYAGLDLRYGEIPENMKKLYLFVLSSIGLGETLDVPGAIKVMQTIREGLGAIRQEAVELELKGQCHPIDHEIRTIDNAIG